MTEHQLIDRRPHGAGVLNSSDAWTAHDRLAAATGAAGEELQMHQQPIRFHGIDAALVESARELVVSTQFGSTSMLQRRLSIGYKLAKEVMGRLESDGVVGPGHGASCRAVLVQPDECWCSDSAQEYGLVDLGCPRHDAR